MNKARSQSMQHRVLVLAPTEKDASFCRTIFNDAELPSYICSGLPEVCQRIEEGAAVAVITEESLHPAVITDLVEVLARQPAWSDFPILVLTREGVASELALRVLETLGNVTLLERPVRVPTLVSAVRTALRARARQYEIRDLLLQESKTAERLRREADRKDEFLAMLAHELRNPLAPIRNGVTILQLGAGVDGDSAEVLAMMDRQLCHMVRLVDDLLDVSRILRGKITLQRKILELPALIKQAAETAQPLIDAQQHRLVLHFEPGPMVVKGDPLRLAQVFANLLNNAAKYTDPGGRITVAVRREGLDTITAVIRDNGVGITAEMLTRVFDLFSQAERSLDRSQGGLGLGLTLVRRLVEMHGGSVSVTSAGLGHGSEFRVSLPAVQQVTAASLAPASKPIVVTAAQHRILVVDDNRDAADSLAGLLTKGGHRVQTRYDGASALDEIRRFKPNVVLLDIGLPGMSGYDVARCIRNSRDDLLLIAITGYGQEEDRRCSFAAGFDHHFVKPIDLRELQDTLNRTVNATAP
jgi:signal transduction histidine kinase/ActR/RegA family two-component response regulator